MINELNAIGFPFDLASLIDKTANDSNLKLITGKSLNELDKGYRETIYQYSDKSQNPNLVCITFATKNPEQFVKESFVKAEELLLDIEKLPFEYKKTFIETIKDIFDFQIFRNSLNNTLTK
jgi:hypothetical protein